MKSTNEEIADVSLQSHMKAMMELQRALKTIVHDSVGHQLVVSALCRLDETAKTTSKSHRYARIDLQKAVKLIPYGSAGGKIIGSALRLFAQVSKCEELLLNDKERAEENENSRSRGKKWDGCMYPKTCADLGCYGTCYILRNPYSRIAGAWNRDE